MRLRLCMALLLLFCLPALAWGEEVDLGQVSMTPSEVYAYKQTLPEGTRLHFSMMYRGRLVTDADTEIDLNLSQLRVPVEDVEALTAICPEVRKITMTRHRELMNAQMIPLVEKYPEIEFVWLISLGGKYTIASDATAYSTFKKRDEGWRLRSEDLKDLKYARNLRALDLGHHDIEDLSFLEAFPDMRILILADNRISDIEPLRNMKHLQYAELFMNRITDLSPLSGMQELLDLNLTANKGIRDLSPLDGCTALERFWCARIPELSQEQQKRFEDMHPMCLADFTAAHSTADGWRQHWRYPQYIAMFKSYTWQEFVPPDP